MPVEPDARDRRLEREAKAAEREGMTLTDFFDQMDRAAFRRSLEHRDVETTDNANPSGR